MGLMSYVTCPTRRYHPAIVAQKAATVGLLSGGRFTLGLGAGENLNEHVVGGWPHVNERHEMLAEALEIIRSLLNGDRLHYAGDHFQVPDAVLWDRPQEGVPIGVAVSGQDSCELAGLYADLMIATEPRPELVQAFEVDGGLGKPKVGQVAICYGEDEHECVRLAHEQFRWFGLGWPVMSELPDPRAFARASSMVTEEQVGQSISCGPDTKKHVDAITRYLDAGFTHVAVVQIGGDTQSDFIDFAERELLPALH
jgi:G6PDH family F420-dependent oxidoreductase